MAFDCDVYLWRQCLILFSDYFHCYGVGFLLSMPAILNPAILSPNSDLRASPDESSWIAASQGITGVVGYIVVPAILQAFGRKMAHFFINGVVVVGFIIFYFATNITHLFIARLIHGFALSGVYVTSIIIAEYSDPKRRGYFISFKKSGVVLGSLSSHFLLVVCTWRHIALIGAISNVLAILMTILWPESPAYLAMKGKFEECDKSHTWLNGNSSRSRKNLENLIAAQSDTRNKKPKQCIIRRVLKNLRRPDFLKPLFITTLLTIVLESSGRYYNLAYIVQIMNDIVKDKSVAVYCSLGNDFLTLIALICSCFVIRKLKRRTILFYFGFSSAAIMFVISLSIFLNKKVISGPLVWLAPCLILLNSFITNVSIVPIAYTVSGEIFPLEHRGVGTCLMGITFTVLYAIVMKCTPVMITETGVDGTYSIYGLVLFVVLVILNLVLNETKDKTLQEIEDEIKGVKRDQEVLVKDVDLTLASN